MRDLKFLQGEERLGEGHLQVYGEYRKRKIELVLMEG